MCSFPEEYGGDHVEYVLTVVKCAELNEIVLAFVLFIRNYGDNLGKSTMDMIVAVFVENVTK